MIQNNLLLLIGIDEYDSSRYCRLNNAKKDLERFRNILETKYGFSMFVDPIYDGNATRIKIVETLNSLSFQLLPEDNIIIYYAGHGDQHQTSKNGSWVPQEAAGPSDLIPNSQVIGFIEGISAKHILLISDSCFSGTYLSRTRGAGTIPSHDELDIRSSRWVFVSGGEEGVSDGEAGKGSPFNRSLCDFLQSNEASTLSAGQVFDHVIGDVQAKRSQTPQAAPIKCDGNEGGEMIFRLQSSVGNEQFSIIKPFFPLPEPQYKYYVARTVTYYDHQQPEISYFFESAQGTSVLIDTIASHKRIVLLGSAGSGKSVELLRLATQLADAASPYIPIYRRFNTYTGQDLEGYLPKGWEEANETTSVILLDGLDEIQPQFLFIALRKIVDFGEQNQKLTIIISCRTNFYELPAKGFSGTLEKFSVFILNDISLQQIRDFATQNLQVDGDEFLRDVYNASFLDLIQKPYFLNLIANQYVNSGMVTANRSQLFEKAIDDYFITDKEHFKTTVYLNKLEVFPQLEKIAFVMELMGKNFIGEEELIKLFPKKEEFEKWKYIPAFKKNEKTGQWMFEHNNIQEYLAARVLASKAFDKLLQIVTLSSSNGAKVRSTWLNTISFFVSISDDDRTAKLLEWIIANDVEVIVRFEPDRLKEDKRIEVFKQIFEFYNSKQIWVASNKFSGADLARFGEFEEVIDYLLEKLNSQNSGRIVKLNAIRVLDDFRLKSFPQKVSNIKKAILALLEQAGFDGSDTYTFIGALANLGITDSDTVERVVKQYRNSKNQYIRAALYKLLHHSEYTDLYLDVLLDGLDLNRIENPIEDRESVNLGDEHIHLTQALKKIKSPPAIKVLCGYFSTGKGHHIYHDEYKEIIESLIENSVNAFKTDPKIYNAIQDFFVASGKIYNKESTMVITRFFDMTDTKWQVFLAVWKSASVPDYEKNELLVPLLDTNIIEHFVQQMKQRQFLSEEVIKLHQLLFWNGSEHANLLTYLKRVEEIATSLAINLERPEVKNWSDVNKKRTQESFDLLFNKQGLLQEIEKIFLVIQKPEVEQEDLFSFHNKFNLYLHRDYAWSAVDLLRDLIYDFGQVSLNQVEQFLQNAMLFEEWQAEAIYKDLHGGQSKLIEVAPEQESQIINWCIHRSENQKLVWFFLHRFKIPLPGAKLLTFTLFYDYGSEGKPQEPGTIEKIEPFLSRQYLIRQVKTNLEQGIPDSRIWLSNASYALRHNLKDVYSLVIDYLQTTGEEEYDLNELLAFWFAKSGDRKRLKQFIQNVNTEWLRRKAVSLLMQSGKEFTFLQSYSMKRMNDENEIMNNRLVAANDLMVLNQVEGLEFAASYILKNHGPKSEFRGLLPKMPSLKDSKAIPWLIRLLRLSKQEGYQNDPFNNLESLIIDALFNIGIQSDDSLKLVTDALNDFIKKYSQIFTDLNFLHFTIIRMQEQLNTQKSKGFSIDDALAEWTKAN